MKAIVYRRYGPPDVLELEDVDKPVVAANDVIIRVRAAGVNRGDWHLLTATPWAVRFYSGLFRPKRKILGFDAAGTVEAVGRNVTGFEPGNEVIATSEDAGAFAQYMRVSQDRVVHKPDNVSDEDAAATPASAITALHGLRDKGRIESGQAVLINGASGGVGTFAVQIAKYFGGEVTAVCSAKNLDTVKSIGADHVIDYTKEDFTRKGEHYDLILDLVGNHSLADCRRVLQPQGMYVSAAGPLTRTARIAMTGGKRMVAFVSQPNQKDLSFVTDLLASGKIKPVIDRRHPLNEVSEAMRYIGEGHARGKIVITM